MPSSQANLAEDTRVQPKLFTDPNHLTGLPLLGSACERVDKIHRRLATLVIDTTNFGTLGPAPDHYEAHMAALITRYGGVLAAGEEFGSFQGIVAVWDPGSRRIGTTHGGQPIFADQQGEIKMGHVEGLYRFAEIADFG